MKKLNYSYIKEYIESFQGYILLSEKYIGSKSPLLIKCPKEHIYSCTWDNFKKGNRCAECYGNKKLNYNEVKNFIEVESNSGCKLLSKEYINATKKLEIECNCGNKFETTFDKFKGRKKYLCNKCSKQKEIENRLFTYDFVKEYIEGYSYKLLSEEYINSQEYLRIECPEGHQYKAPFHVFKSGVRCSKCYGNKKLTYKEVKDFIEVESESGCKLVSKTYKNNSHKLTIQCKCGEMFETNFTNFCSSNKRQCYKCGLPTGEKHHHWNPELTNEERIIKRDILENKEWTKNVYKRDNYTCQICGQCGGKLNAHHLDGYHWCKEKRFDIENGITLCEKCHDNFHKSCGIKYNTADQFKDYQEKYQI